MLKRKFAGLFIFLLLLGLAGTVLAADQAADSDPIPIQFRKAGGGQWIYCNNPEFIGEKDLSTIDNPTPTYMMTNENLGPGKYSVFFCFYNWTLSDVEPDIEFSADSSAVITIHSIGYYMPTGYEYWDCIGAWADYMGIHIKTLNRYQQYVPYEGPTSLPKTIRLDQASDWISKYIYNYDVVKPHLSFNMLVDFTIESGETDVNFAALKNHGILGDRSYHAANAAPGVYYRDTSVKGIETESLPMVESDLNVVIDQKVKNGDALPVKVFNQFYPEGSVMPHWMTNINPSRDEYFYSKLVAAGSDMLSLRYKDDSKLSYYGSKVPQSQKDNTWVFDIYHHDTTAYQPQMPWDRDTYVPNAFTGTTLDIDNLPDPQWELNLGNFGVTNRYHLTVTNKDTVPRFLNYMLETSLSSNIVIARDERGNMLNPYTLSPQDPFALCKGIHSEKQEDCMFSVEIPPGQTRKYRIDVILPTNNLGGIINTLKVDDHTYLTHEKSTPYPSYTTLYPYQHVFFNGQSPMKWEGGSLYQYAAPGHWEHIRLPGSAMQIFGAKSQEFRIVKAWKGYVARNAAWDGLGDNVVGKDVENNLYFFDDQFQFTKKEPLSDYVYNMVYADNSLYVQTDKVYSSSDGKTFLPVDSGLSFPLYNGTTLLFQKGNELIKKNKDGSITPLVFENAPPHELFSAQELFYYRKSWKSYYTDDYTPNILSVSYDSINWTDLEFPGSFLDLKQVCLVGGKIYVDCKYQTFTFDAPPKDNLVIVNLNNKLLSFAEPAKLVSDRVMVPLRFFFEQLGAKVEWIDETQQIRVTQNGSTVQLQIGSKTALVNGQEKPLDVPPYLDHDKTMIPTRFLTENLGYTVKWDAASHTATITQK